MGAFLEALPAVAGFLGDVFGASSAKKAAKRELAFQKEQFAYQKELNANQVLWRVQDAQRAGIHPLYALGPTGATFSPLSGPSGDGGGEYLSRAGQDLGRAIDAVSTAKERRSAEYAAAARQRWEDDQSQRLNEANIRRLDAETAEILSRTARLRGSAQVGPSVPEGTVTVRPSERTATARGDRSAQAGVAPERRFFMGPDGWIRPARSYERAQSQADSESFLGNLGEMDWDMRNLILPRLGVGPYGTNPGPPPGPEDGFALRPGYEWVYDRFYGGWQQRPRRERQSSRHRRLMEDVPNWSR